MNVILCEYLPLFSLILLQKVKSGLKFVGINSKSKLSIYTICVNVK